LIIIFQQRLISSQTEFQEKHGFGTASQFLICLNCPAVKGSVRRTNESITFDTFTLAVVRAWPIDS
jgi:hypothetical protein